MSSHETPQPQPTPVRELPGPDYTKRDLPGQHETIKPRDRLPTEPPTRPPKDRQS